MELTLITAEEAGIEESRAQEIQELYNPFIEHLNNLGLEYQEVISNEEITEEVALSAGALRRRIVKVRTAADKARKKAKEVNLRENNAIQSAFNTFEKQIKEKEDNLLKREKHFELIEQERIEKLRFARETELKEVNGLIPPLLGEMDEAVYNNYLAGAKANYEAQKEAERKEEEERKRQQEIEEIRSTRYYLLNQGDLIRFNDIIDDLDILGTMSNEEWDNLTNELSQKKQAWEDEQQQIKAENERLKEEARKIEEEQKRIRQEQEDALKLEREQRQKIEQELKQKELDQLKAQQEEEARLEAEASKDDDQKLTDLIEDLTAITSKYKFKSRKNKKMFEQLKAQIKNMLTLIADEN